jgi:hypothetical protein
MRFAEKRAQSVSRLADERTTRVDREGSFRLGVVTQDTARRRRSRPRARQSLEKWRDDIFDPLALSLKTHTETSILTSAAADKETQRQRSELVTLSNLWRSG